MALNSEIGWLISALVILCSCVAEEEWDFFVFAQTWPQGTCVAAQHEHHKCSIPKNVTTWCIHGLWPSVYDGKPPEDCNPNLPFKFDEISSLEPNLTLHWPNLYIDTAPDSFWEHEWTKHGTCCQDLKATMGEMNYFTAGLMQHQKFKIENFLFQAQIFPSSSQLYYHNNFTDAIKQATNFEPVVECTSMKLENGTEYQTIGTVEICLTKDFSITHCSEDIRAVMRGDSTSLKFKKMHSNSTSLKFEGGHTMYSLTQDPVYVMYWKDGWKSTNCPKKGFYYPPIIHD